MDMKNYHDEVLEKLHKMTDKEFFDILDEVGVEYSHNSVPNYKLKTKVFDKYCYKTSSYSDKTVEGGKDKIFSSREVKKNGENKIKYNIDSNKIGFFRAKEVA
ncbi:MAG: hypothetical protein ACOCRK_10665 [bacterium]